MVVGAGVVPWWGASFPFHHKCLLHEHLVAHRWDSAAVLLQLLGHRQAGRQVPQLVLA